jgi:hypothetical protein
MCNFKLEGRVCIEENINICNTKEIHYEKMIFSIINIAIFYLRRYVNLE